ncbi:hypothetical protein GGTG_10516 [Gaeumannomyces tritici R3-111a-1]|uniref:Uncharacterized protein n=1 Tax=Gaeumannomyces tritici (strain R3-111a-1) TaxID=644352 RepID=J3PAJ1_GAET3|nr:hypothetical protein GGTG_10516 [Gaeumannomyces tritici R3-111a-1]EJT71257.1 hypothetical protein GGTG_10516 [Gaeumannomyces tritici R3-111a-1]
MAKALQEARTSEPKILRYQMFGPALDLRRGVPPMQVRGGEASIADSAIRHDSLLYPSIIPKGLPTTGRHGRPSAGDAREQAETMRRSRWRLHSRLTTARQQDGKGRQTARKC